MALNRDPEGPSTKTMRTLFLYMENDDYGSCRLIICGLGPSGRCIGGGGTEDHT